MKADLLSRAKLATEAGEKSLHDAAELIGLGDELDEASADAREMERTSTFANIVQSPAVRAAWDRELAAESAYFGAKRAAYFAWEDRQRNSPIRKSKPLPWTWGQEIEALKRRAALASFDEDMALHDRTTTPRQRIDAVCAEEFHRGKYETVEARVHLASPEERALGEIDPDFSGEAIHQWCLIPSEKRPPCVDFTEAEQAEADAAVLRKLQLMRVRRRSKKTVQRRQRAAAFAD